MACNVFLKVTAFGDLIDITQTLIELYATIPDVVDKLHTKGGKNWIVDTDTSKNVMCFTYLKN